MTRLFEKTFTIHNAVLFLTGTIALISFALSYQVLVNVAQAGGKPEQLSYLWPLIIDLPIIAFSLVAIVAVRNGRSRKGAWSMVAFATALTVGFNIWYHWGSLLSVIVGATAPVMYLLSFEAFLWAVKLSTPDPVVSELPDNQQTTTEIVSEMSETPPPPKLTKADRLAQLPALVSEGLTKAELAGRLIVSQKTIERDLAALNGKGVFRDAV